MLTFAPGFTLYQYEREMKHRKLNLHKAWEMFKHLEHPSKEMLDNIALLAGFQNWSELHSVFQEECIDSPDDDSEEGEEKEEEEETHT